MPELPDIALYLEALDRYVSGHVLRAIRLTTPFLVRSVEPAIGTFVGQQVERTARIGKRIVLCFPDEHFLVLHLMIAGRLRWRASTAKPLGRAALAAFVFDHGTLYFTEAGTTRRASLTAVRGRRALATIDRGGMDPLHGTLVEFAERLQRENHTVKRSLTDPRLFSGIGNAYSDEILHDARLSPVLLTSRMTPEQIEALYRSTQRVLAAWIDRLRHETGDGFPETVTSFREGMAVHGRFGKPCPVCEAPVQRIRYASNETNYCARCQTGGKLLADRGLSRLLKGDWPKSIDDLE